MELDNTGYGIFHIPTLLIFHNELSRDPAVRTLLYEGLPLELVPTSPSWEALSDDAKSDFVQHATCLYHERRHFHDMMMTAVGLRLVRLAFRYVLTVQELRDAVTARVREGKDHLEIKLPLRTDNPTFGPLIGEALAAQAKYASLFNDALNALELSATTLQIASTHFFRQPGTLSSLLKSFNNTSYAPLQAGMTLLLDRLTHPPDGGLPIFDIHQAWKFRLELTWLSLCSAKSSNVLWALIGDLIERTEPDRLDREELRRYLDAKLNGMREGGLDNLAREVRYNRQFIDEVSSHPRASEATRTVLLNTFVDFYNATSKGLNRLFNDPHNLDWYLNPYAYFKVSKTLPAPMIYLHLTGEDVLSVESDLAARYEPDELSEVLEYPDLDSGGKITQISTAPSRWQFKGVRMKERWWINYAVEVVGSVALVEGFDPRHPIKGFWVRGVNRGGELTFTR
jgi:hypothetical protein